MHRERLSAAAAEQFTRLVQEGMERCGFTIKDISDKVEITYEHARRIVRGEALPSKYVIKLIGEALGIEYDTLIKAALADRLRRKYGAAAVEQAASRLPSGLEELARLWDDLTEENRRDLTAMARAWA